MPHQKFRLIRAWLIVLISLYAIVLSPGGAHAQQAERAAEIGVDETAFSFISLLFLQDSQLAVPMKYIEANWEPSHIAMALDVLSLNRRSEVRSWLIGLMREKTGENLNNDLHVWFNWMWNRPEQRYPHYAQFKSFLYRLIDPKFAEYFSDDRETTIRLDEVRWGGVQTRRYSTAPTTGNDHGRQGLLPGG